MAAMNEEQIKQFDYEHKKMLEENYPESFTVKHKIFLTWYNIEKQEEEKFNISIDSIKQIGEGYEKEKAIYDFLNNR